MGNSLGGHIALLYALNYPALVDALVLSGSSGIYEATMGSTFFKRQDREFIKERTEMTFYDPRHATEELVDEIKAQSDLEDLRDPSHILLLLNVGSVYPFTRASELLDELDRRNVSSTIGEAFPGRISNGKLAAYGSDPRGYYPAHLIDGRISEVDLQQ